MNRRDPCPPRLVAAAFVAWLALAPVASSHAQNAPRPEIPVRVDERVELMSIVFRLVGAREYHMASDDAPYVQQVDVHFGPFKDHAAIRLAAKLRAERGISYDAVASYAVHLQGGPQLAPKIPFDDPKLQLESRWSPASAGAFLTALQQFADESDAFGFFEAHRDYYDTAAQRLENEIARRPYREWLNGFFGAAAGASFTGIVGLLNGGGNYGVKVVYPDGRLEILPIIGAARFDEAGLPVFSADDAGTLAHEFCHSFCNPLVDKHLDRLLPAANKIYPHRRELLKQQAYSSAETMLYESMVRACTHRFLVAHGTAQEAARSLSGEVSRGFLWTPELSALLAEYERSRDVYPTLDSFMPRIVAFFDDVAESIAHRMAQLPHVVTLSPANGATTVDPATQVLAIKFDRRMSPQGYSIVGGSSAPRTTGRGRYDDEGLLFTIPIQLEPETTYTFSLNSLGFSGFRSAEGWPLDPLKVTFTTIGR